MTNDKLLNAILVLGAVLAAACGGDDGAESTAPPAAQVGATASAGMTPTPVAGSGMSGRMAMAPVMGASGRPAQPPVNNPTTNAGTGAGGAMARMPMTPNMPMPTATAGMPAMPTDKTPDPSTPPTPGAGSLPKVSSTEMDGPFQAMGGVSGSFYVWRPTELGKDGLKHPVFVWGTGAGAMPERYNEYFPRFATHGIIVVSPNKAQKDASDMKAAVDWIIAQNGDMSSPFYQKIDPMRIGMGGHSQGSVATFDQEGMESRLKTTIHIAGGSFDMRGSSKVKTPTAYICGETDFALPNCEADFDTVEDQPTFFSVLKGVDHVACARNAMPGMIAWLRWHLGGETERKAEFAEGGKYHMGIWVSQTKNF